MKEENFESCTACWYAEHGECSLGNEPCHPKTDKERIIAFLQKLLPNDFICGHFSVTFNDDGSLFITVSNRKDEQEGW